MRSRTRRRLRSSSVKRPSKRQFWASGDSGNSNAPMRRTLRTLRDLRSVWWCGPECRCSWRRDWSKKRDTHRRHCNFLSRCRQLWLNTASFVSSRNSTSLLRMNNVLGYGSYRLVSQHHNSFREALACLAAYDTKFSNCAVAPSKSQDGPLIDAIQGWLKKGSGETDTKKQARSPRRRSWCMKFHLHGEGELGRWGDAGSLAGSSP